MTYALEAENAYYSKTKCWIWETPKPEYDIAFIE